MPVLVKVGVFVAAVAAWSWCQRRPSPRAFWGFIALMVCLAATAAL
ncbi:hypothetical protein [Nonomuraea dietziae]